MRPRIGFTSTLHGDYLADLEKLLFFNPQQDKALSGISESIQEFGVPRISQEGGYLRIHVENLPGAQTLFALEDTKEKAKLVGVMIFSRIDAEIIVLLHIAVLEEYSRFGPRADVGLVGKMMAELRAIARRLNGVRSIHLKYAKGLIFPV